MSRILVIRGGAIGDFILTLPALRLLRESFSEAHIEVLGYPHIVALGLTSGLVDATRSIEAGALASFFSRGGELAPDLVRYFESFQQVISYLHDPDEIFADNLRRAGVRNLITASPKITGSEHAARQLARPLEQLGLYFEDAAARLDLPASRRDAHLLALHPGSGSERKNWPVERFLAVAQAWLAPNEQRKLLVVGGEADGEQLGFLKKNLPNERCDYAENLPLPELAARLARCGVFLGHDSGISHLTAAVGTPALLLFGPTDPEIWAPLNQQVQVLRSARLTIEAIQVFEVLPALMRTAEA